MGWFPGKRDDVLNMAEVWKTELTANGTSWGFPASELTGMNILATEAKTRWDLENNPETKTPVVVQQARMAFRALEAKMRYIKRHWLLTPPLSPANLTALCLPVADGEPSEIPAPTAQVEAELSFPGVHMVLLTHFRPIGGHSANPKSDHGVAVHYGLTGTPSENHPLRLTGEPTTGKQLPDYCFVTGDKLLLDLEGESGQTIYISMCYENAKGQAGPFGPIIKAVVP